MMIMVICIFYLHYSWYDYSSRILLGNICYIVIDSSSEACIPHILGHEAEMFSMIFRF